MTTCQKCGAALDSEGMCAMCLLAGGVGTELPTLTSAGGVTGTEPAQALDYDSFGPYRILRVLGEGGMGAVYLAEQTQPLKRQVALKVVKLGLDSSQILSRFNYERQALALMDHPNIAHVYDAGASEKGRPYFVMEFVDGLPITQYCDQHRLNTVERLELFVPVCQALHHAHQKGVIHRDIKPSNVMVTEQDGRPVPKVIDFGIAKATDQRAIENAAFTNLGQFIGTPEYMSPEQADVLTGDIDTSSDVYSLGVLLYELLVGAVPFDANMLRKAGLSELLRIIREDEAIPMTAKLTAMGATATEVAERRRTDPGTLRRQVTGDLNWIVMRAMEKDRQRRYPAVSELAADIRRHLDDQPVLASPPSPIYRTRKFVRRHKLGVVAASAVLFALVAGIVATSWEAAIAQRERAEALRQKTDAVAARALAEQRSKETVAERNRAEEQTALAVRQEEIAERQRTIAETRLGDVHSLADSMLFEINDDVKDLAGGTKAREALVRLGQQYLNKEAAGMQADPHRRQELAEAFIRVGELQGKPGESNLRDVAGARESFGRSVTMLESEVQASPRDAHLRHLMTLAYLRQAQLDETESKTKYERAANSAEIFVAHWPKDPQALRDRAEVLQAKGENAVAEELRERILAQNPSDPVIRWELGKAQLALGDSLTYKNNQKALEWLQKAADAFAALNKEDPSNVQYQRDRAVALVAMSEAMQPMNRYDEGETLAKQAVAILEQLTASDSRNASFRQDLSSAHFRLGLSVANKGRIAEGIKDISMALAVQEEEAANHLDNPDFPRHAARYLRSLGYLNHQLADSKGAMQEYRKAEAIDRRLVARYPGRFEFAEALRSDIHYIADTFLALGDKESSLRAYREALGIAQTNASQPTEESLLGLAFAHRGVADGLAAMGRWDEAIAEDREVIAAYERRAALDPSDRDLQREVPYGYRDLASLYSRRQDYKSAIAVSEKVLPFLEADYAAHRDDLSSAEQLWNMLFYLRNQYTDAGDYDHGIAAGRRSVEIAEQITAGHLGDYARSHFLASSLLNLGGTFERSGRREESLTSLRKAVAVLDQHPVEKEPSPLIRHDMASTYLNIAGHFNILWRPEESSALCNRVLPVLETVVRDNPGNNLYRNDLLLAYRHAALASRRMGDLASALAFEQKALQLQPAPNSPSEIENRAFELARTGSLQLRLGRHAAAFGIWREALAMFQKAGRESEQHWSADKKNLHALETLRLSEQRVGFTLDELGDPEQSLRYLKSSLAHAEALMQADSASQANHNSYNDSLRSVLHHLSATASSPPDYRPFFEKQRQTSSNMAREVVLGWRDHLRAMNAFASPISERLDAVRKAQELARGLISIHPDHANSEALAVALQAAGDVYLEAGRLTGGEESMAAYRQSQACYAEAKGIMQPLKDSNKLTYGWRYSLVELTNNLAAVEERLREAPLTTLAKP